MTDTDSRMAYSAALGLCLGALAYSMKWVSGANVLAFAAMPAAAIVGHFILESWRNSAGRDKFEPLASYGLVIVFATALFGLFFARAPWVSQFAALLAASLIAPLLVAWVLDRNTIKGEVDASVSEAQHVIESE